MAYYREENKKKICIYFYLEYSEITYYISNIATMKKQDFIKAVAAKANLSQDATSNFLAAFIEVVTEEVKSGEGVNITAFGKFEKTERSARNGVNPRTREKMVIPAMSSIAFRPGKTLKEAVR